MTVQIDTNVLLRISQGGHPQHRVALRAVESLESSGRRLCMVPQNIFEFWAVATRPTSVNGLGLEIEEVRAEIARIRRTFDLHLDRPEILPEWEGLVAKYACKGKASHDARIVAAMLVHGVKALLIFNGGDFARYEEITLFDPAIVGAGASE